MHAAQADPTPQDQQQKPYKKKDIVNARFGEEEKQQLMRQAYGLQGLISDSIVGQDRIGKAMQDRLVQYLENFGTRTKDPIAFHMIGLPGIGKSATLDVLDRMGIKMLRVDAQAFSGLGASHALEQLAGQLYQLQMEQRSSKRPLILLFDEIDKVPEIIVRDGVAEEVSNPLIGFLNQILADGKVPHPGNPGITLDLSNVMVVSAMNFSPQEIERFSKEALGENKSFYDFTVEDFERFDDWLRKETSARSKVLSRLFRSNTVSRLAPNTLIVKPLNHADYRKIVTNNVERAIDASSKGELGKKRLQVGFTERYLNFLGKYAVYPPSGARETVIKANALTEQLIGFAARLPGPDRASLAQPRSVLLDFDPATGQGRIEVTPLYRRGKETVKGKAFETSVEFDPDSRSFVQPRKLAINPPPLKEAGPSAEKPLTKRQILEARFPKGSDDLKGLAKEIDTELIGQEEYTQLIEDDLKTFVARTEPVEKNPPFRVIAGFPGIGKSALANLAGEYAGLPIARLNMQAYAGSDSKAATDFVMALDEAVSMARMKSKDGKFILLLEELDKVFEVDPQSGAFVNRPVMNFVKDLLNDGYIKATVGDGVRSSTRLIDARNAYSMVTMNFAVERFGFTADPRMTSIDDVIGAWKVLKNRPADLKKVLGTMFLPETVNRLLPRFVVMKPLEKRHYEKIIRGQVDAVIQDRLYDPLTGEDKARIEVRLTPRYRSYLYKESVIPSEGARNTVIVSEQRLSGDLEDALAKIPKSSKYAAKPITLELDFKPGSSSVTVTMAPQTGRGRKRPVEILRKPVELTFPPLKAVGKIPAPRLLTSIHEFGHAFTGVRLGKRFDYATVVPPRSGVGGYVRFKSPTERPASAQDMISDIYAFLGSRAMERIFLSERPLSKESVLSVTSGASKDILQATEKLWDVMYELGFDPGGSVIERMGVDPPRRYAHFADLPAEDVQKLGKVLRQMEDYVVADLIKAHPKSWYVERVAEFARAGGVDEKGFYRIIGYPYPGDNAISLGAKDRIHEIFKGIVKEEPAEALSARGFKQGHTRSTAGENLSAATEFFASTVRRLVHGEAKPASGGRCNPLLEELKALMSEGEGNGAGSRVRTGDRK